VKTVTSPFRLEDYITSVPMLRAYLATINDESDSLSERMRLRYRAIKAYALAKRAIAIRWLAALRGQ
jgi:hypothetical protein